MPDVRTVLGWAMDQNHDFYHQYKEARIKQAEMQVDELVDLAKSAFSHVRKTAHGVGVDPAAVAAIKLQIDTRKWAASKVFPKVYGDKMVIEEPQRFIPLPELCALVANESADE